MIVDPLDAGTVTVECGMLHVRVNGGAAHELKIGSTDALRVEWSQAVLSPYSLAARYHSSFNQADQSAGVFARIVSPVDFTTLGESYSGGSGSTPSLLLASWTVSPSSTHYTRYVPLPWATTRELKLTRTTDGGTQSLYRWEATPIDGGTFSVSGFSSQTWGFYVGNGSSPPATDVYLEYLLFCQ